MITSPSSFCSLYAPTREHTSGGRGERRAYSSSFRIASCRCRGTIRRFLLSRAAFPASSSTSAARYSSTAARYTARRTSVRDEMSICAGGRTGRGGGDALREPPALEEAVHAAHGELQARLGRARHVRRGGLRLALALARLRARPPSAPARPALTCARTMLRLRGVGECGGRESVRDVCGRVAL
jgi:hypothetical protein